MGNESSAVNDLISLVSGKPLGAERGDDLLFRMPRAVKPAKSRPRRAEQIAPVLPLTVLPAKASKPVQASAIPTLRTVKSVPPSPILRTVKSTKPVAIAIPVALPVPLPAPSAPPRARSSRPARTNETTRFIHRSFASRLVFVIVLLGIGGLSMAGYLVLMGGRTDQAPVAEVAEPASVHVAAAATAPIEAPRVAAAVEPPKPTALPLAKPALVAIRIDSQPAGANVVLVDNGASSFIGTTPIEASVDPARTYEVVFALDGQTTKIAALDPKATTRLSVAFDAPPAVAPAAVIAAPVATTEATASKAPQRSKRTKVATKPVKQIATKPAATKPAKKPAKPAAKQVATAETGVLMVSSKPPCSIIVDGKPTMLTTPQRALTLTAGTHKVTLINAQQNIKKTFSVQIKPQGSTKLIEDFLKTSARRSTSRR